MKDKNHGNNVSTLLVLMLILLLSSTGCKQVKVAPVQQFANANVSADDLVFEGELVNLGPDPGLTSGRFAAYRLAKYRVLKVCSGTYDQSVIVVDHAIFTAKEFDGITPGDRVCVIVKKSDKISARYNAEGIRSASEDVTTFYIANEFKRVEGSIGCCENQPK